MPCGFPDKYYKVLKDTPLWRKNAVLSFDEDLGEEGGYSPIDDMWNMTDKVGTEHISSPIVEEQPEWFERVYKNKKDKFMSKATALAESAKNFIT